MLGSPKRSGRRNWLPRGLCGGRSTLAPEDAPVNTIDVVAGIIRHQGLILIARRKSGSHLAGCWEFPGGKVEPGERPEDTLVRELQEEFSISTKTGSFVAESLYDYGTKRIRLLGYLSSYLGGDFTLESHDEVRWVRLEEIASFPLAPADVPILQALMARGDL